MDHLERDEYLLTLTGEIPWEQHLDRSHRHLLELCEVCAGDWDGERGALKVEDPQPAAEEDREEREERERLEMSLAEVEAEKRLLSHMRRARRLAMEDLRKLEQTPEEEWPELVRRSRKRFRSRALADVLIEQSRAKVRTAPERAAAFAALVPLVLHRQKGREGLPWVQTLTARARAHRANALRVQGDLPAAESAFAELRRWLQPLPPESPAVQAELASLEASLRIGQRRFDDAEGLLTRAADDFLTGGDREGWARCLIAHANLRRTLGQPAEALTLLRTAADRLDAGEHPYLAACTVTGRVNALCDLGRTREAETVLVEHEDLYTGADEFHGAIYRLLWARADLGQERLEAAEAGFTEAREELLALGRDYDATLTSLYLADALLTAGKLGELRDLAQGLIPVFEALGVPREALASLRLLVEAVRAETVTAASIAQVRRSLLRAR